MEFLEKKLDEEKTRNLDILLIIVNKKANSICVKQQPKNQ